MYYAEAPFVPALPDSHNRNFMDSVEDAWSVSVQGDVQGRLNQPQFVNQPDYNFYEDFKKLTINYQDTFEQFADAQSPEEFDYIKSRIDEYRGASARLEQDGFFTNLAAQGVVMLSDPVTYTPLPLLKGIGFGKAALLNATALGGYTLASQAYGAYSNPNRTGVEVASYVGGAAVIGGLIGGAVGRFGATQAAQTIAPSGSLQRFASNYFGAHAQAEGLPIVKSIDVDGLIRDVEYGMLPTGSTRQFTDWIPEVPATATTPLIPEKLLVDEAALTLSFNNAPWSQGPGALAVDAFTTPREWKDFNILKAMQEKINPRMAAETADQYEERITREAFSQVDGARKPLAMAIPQIAKIAQPGSVNAIAASLFNKDTYLWDGILKLAGDHQTLNLANRANKENPDSVFLSSARMIGGYIYDMTIATNEQYAKYLSGAAPTSGRVVTAVKNAIVNTPVIGRTLRNGKLDSKSFRELVGVATENPGLAVYKGQQITPEMHALADHNRAMLNKIDEYARKHGLYEDIISVNNDITKLRDIIDKKMNFAESINARIAANQGPRFARLRSTLSNRLARTNLEITDLESRLAVAETTLDDLKITPRTPRGVASYFPHVYRLDVIRERRAEFETLVADIFLRDGHMNPVGAAQEATRKILGEGPPAPAIGLSQASYLKSREIPGSLVELGDFLELDSELVLKGYLSKIIPALEMTRVFGDYRMSKQLDELRLYLNQKFLNEPNRAAVEKTYDDTIQLFEDTRDRILGNFGPHDPLELTKTGSRMARNAASLSYMGQVIYSAFSDAGRVLGTLGPRNIFHGFAAYLQHDLAAVKIQQRYAPAVGEALDIILGSAMQRFSGGTESLLRRDGNMVARFLEGAQGPYYIANLLSPWTVALKQFSSLIGAHVILKDCLHMASKITQGLEPDPKIAAQLASFGINRADALLIAKMPHTSTDSGKLMLTNITEWVGKEGDVAKQKFLSALQGRIRQSVTTPGIMDRPRLLDGVIYKRGTRRRIEETLNVKRQEIDTLRQQLTAMAPAQGNATVAAQMDLIKAEIKAKRVEIGRIQGTQAAESRGGTPLLMLPTQFMAFPFAMASKMLQSVATGREKAAVTGMMSLFGLAYLSNWAKTPSYAWDKQPIEEKIYNAFSRSGVAGWLESPMRVADVMAHAGPRAMLGIDDPFGPPGIPEKLGAVGGPAVSLGANIMNAMFNPDYGIDERYGILRRNLPFANHLLVKPLLKFLGDEVVTPLFGDGVKNGQPAELSQYQSIAGSLYESVGNDDHVYPNEWNPAPTIIRTQKTAGAPVMPSPVPVAPAAPVPIAPMPEGNPLAREPAIARARAAAPPLPELPIETPLPPEGNPAAREQPTAPARQMEFPPQPEGQPGLRDQPTLPARAELPQPEGNPGARDQSAWVLQQPEGKPGNREQMAWSIRQPEGKGGMRDQPTLPARAPVPPLPPLPDVSEPPAPKDTPAEQPRVAIFSSPRMKRYIIAMERVESSDNADAVNAGTGASGPHQFLASTWRAVTAEMGVDWTLTDRFDKQKSREAALYLTNQNRKALEREFDRNPNETELYLAHFLGSNGAARFIRGYESDPDQASTLVVDKASVRANKPIFYERGTNRTRSVREVYNLMKTKIEKAMPTDLAAR